MYSSNYTAPHPRRLEPSATPLCEPLMLHSPCGLPQVSHHEMKIIAFNPFKSDVYPAAYRTSVPTSQITQISVITKTDKVTLFRKTIAAWSVTQNSTYTHTHTHARARARAHAHSYRLCGADISQSYIPISTCQFLRVFINDSLVLLRVRSICQTTSHNALHHTSQKNDVIINQELSTQVCSSSVYSSTRGANISVCIQASVYFLSAKYTYQPASQPEELQT
jgi:hypothetical protein